MKKSNLFRTTIPVIAFIFLLILTFSCQQQVEEGITEEEAQAFSDSDVEVWNGGDLSLCDEFISPEIVYHPGDGSEDLVGIEAFKENITSTRTIFPDFNVIIDDLIFKGDKVVARWTVTGTNSGPIPGPSGDLPPSGKTVKLFGVNISQVVDGKITEQWVFYDNAGFLTQLGYTITPPSIEGEGGEGEEGDDDDEE